MPRGAKRNSHGGYRKPGQPAPVSGDGALSQRTDGGPADTQPVRLASGGRYGERQALQAQQSSAPMAAATPPQTGAGGPVPLPAPVAPDPFGPTQRPGEPITAGIPLGPGPTGPILPSDPLEFARVLYSIAPDPAVAELFMDRLG